MTQIKLFEYDQIDIVNRDFVRDRTVEIKALVKRSAQDIIEIGLKLIEVKERLPHGMWGAWLDNEFGWGQDTATRFMNVAVKFRNLRNLDMYGQSALYLLASPSTPDKARDEAIDRAINGEVITHKVAKEIVNSYKEIEKPAFTCPECDQIFNTEVWHCLFCNGHWQLSQRDCPNCYKDKLDKKEASDAKRIQRDAPEVFEQMRTGEIATVAEAKRMAARLRIPAPADTPPLPKDKYRCIVIDPPWPIKKIEREERPNQGIELDYPVMTLDEIKSLPIRDLADSNGCHLYLWVTQKFLPVGLELIEVWGFRYQCLMTWVKNVGITPYSWMYDTEHVIFARMGNLPLNQLGLRLSFGAKVSGHSVKPDVFFDERVKLVSPEPRLEMFARKKRDGFTVWGNEVNG